MRHTPFATSLLTALVACSVLGQAPAVATTAAWRWPLDPAPVVVAAFAAPSGPFTAGHRGADLAARVGQPVLSAGTGVVAFAGPVAGRGVVSVDHPDGRRSTYEPVTATVLRGDPVSEGAVLGQLSAAPGHCLPATCLHWGLRRGDTYLDPRTLMGDIEVRLLPLWAPADLSDAPPRPGAAHHPAGPVALAHEPSPASREPPDRGPLLAGLRAEG